MNRNDLKMHYDDPKLFVQSQWQKGERSLTFLIFRWVLAGCFIAIVIYSFAKKKENYSVGIWFADISSYGILFCLTSTSVASILTTMFHFDAIRLKPESIRFYWILSTIATAMAFMITIVHYTFFIYSSSMAVFNGLSR